MLVIVGAFLPLTKTEAAPADPSADYDFVHDPAMIKEGDQYYVFSTGDPDGAVGNGNIQIRTSTDMRNWEYIGTVFDQIPSWITDELGSIPNLWAPDIHYMNGRYHLYYSGSTFGSNHSVIGLATNRTLDPSSPEYRWEDQGIVFRSTQEDNYNAIDPNLVMDDSGQPWLAFGSFWSGIKMIELDSETGKPTSPTPSIHSIAQREPPGAIEAPSIIQRDGYYYHFVSFDSCCQGTDSTYRTMVGRSKNITGPYVDPDGTSMLNGGGMQFLGNEGYMIGQGGGSVYREGDQYYFVHHYYDARDNGNPKLQIRRIDWMEDGWPYAGPAIRRGQP
ncbi:arabinan endo-1,5-alpha-L-arabinosidase [Paludifilum halophilum]|uniref:Endo-alpha-(1->5)-L-arabinanase n=2 Tax=Paludifilum halophilum TaxID=1642702 RepID=A0A235B4U5_9BACL|nr:arabinan endo-1,5-alpha-L-arabinosidase [Paludifilum halophilum]